MKLGTEKFKDAVTKAIRGSSQNPNIPLTTMIGIKSKDGKLCLYTTDMTNSLVVIVGQVTAEEINATVDADKFSKLISKITSDDIELLVENDSLVIKANGTYKLPMIADEEGLVSFPEPKMVEGDEHEVLLSSVMSVYNANEAALAKDLDQPYLTGYYVGDKVISTDATVITFNDLKLIDSSPVLIPAQMMTLLTLNSQEKIMCKINGDDVQFITDEIIVTGKTMEGIEDFPVDAINKYLDTRFESSCKVSKELLLNVLDRLSLFIEPYDKNGAYFTFGQEGITIHSKKDSSTELVRYIESNNFQAFMCCVDIPALKEQVESIPEDTIKLFYGDENAFKIECGKITQVIALLEDDNLEA